MMQIILFSDAGLYDALINERADIEEAKIVPKLLLQTLEDSKLDFPLSVTISMNGGLSNETESYFGTEYFLRTIVTLHSLPFLCKKTMNLTHY